MKKEMNKPKTNKQEEQKQGTREASSVGRMDDEGLNS
jgi:hypothetical protein